MITLTILTGIAVVIALVILLTIGVLGIGGLIIFGDLFVALVIIRFIYIRITRRDS